jgi:hypothetical protein
MSAGSFPSQTREAKIKVPRGLGLMFGLLVAVFAVFICLFIGAYYWFTKQIGHEQYAMEQLLRCPEARAMLGEPIEIPLPGVGWGSAKSAGAFGYASWSMGVRGSKTEGEYLFNAEKHNGNWSLTGARLVVGGQTINIGACVAGSQSAGLPGATNNQTVSFLAGRCDAGEEAMCWALAEMHVASKDLGSAAHYYMKACDQGLARGSNAFCTMAAGRYDDGKLMPRDPERAESFRRKARS